MLRDPSESSCQPSSTARAGRGSAGCRGRRGSLEAGGTDGFVGMGEAERETQPQRVRIRSSFTKEPASNGKRGALIKGLKEKNTNSFA